MLKESKMIELGMNEGAEERARNKKYIYRICGRPSEKIKTAKKNFS